jgi:hypothetical protein
MEFLDSNVFIFATISTYCAQKVQELQKRDYGHLVLYSVREEVEAKLFEIHTAVVTLQSELKDSNSYLNLLHSYRFQDERRKYPQIWQTMIRCIQEGYFNQDSRFDNFREFLDLTKKDIRGMIHTLQKRRKLYPKTYNEYLDSQKHINFQHSFGFKLSFMNEAYRDRKHLALSGHYCCTRKKEALFYTTDKKDILSKSEKIESRILGLTICPVPNFDPENIKVKH